MNSMTAIPGCRCLLILGCLLLSDAFAKEPADSLEGPPFVSARAWAIGDSQTGELLWSSQADLPLKAASTTKIMCAWIVLELARNDPQVLAETVTFSQLADETAGSTSGIKAGEQISVGQCLYGLLLPSGNDAGNALAEHFNERFAPQTKEPKEPNAAQAPKTVVATGFETRGHFIAEMNRRARELGLKNTRYRLPYGDGGTAEDRTTTARDLWHLARVAMQNPLFRKYVATPKHQTKVRLPDGTTRSIAWGNTNQLLGIDGYHGIKTGTNSGAGACLVSSGRRGDDELLVVVLGATSGTGRYVDSRNLYRWAWRQRGHTGRFGKTTKPKTRQASVSAGFYKDVFMSSGVRLSSRKRLPAAESLGLSIEYYAGSDAAQQNAIISGSVNDTNGALLYPDGQPRFRMIYVNGGGATLHGKSLERPGRDALRTFYRRGGSYCGSCAGSFLSGRNTDKHPSPRLGYLHIFPYNTRNTGVKKTRVGHDIPPASPLHQFRNFGPDRYVPGVYHNNGNWLSLKEGPHLADTEVLATYFAPGLRPHAGAAIWAYKPTDDVASGRIINIGSHPEGISDGARLALTEACFLYALAGTGEPEIKGRLEFGKTRVMNKHTQDALPESTRIGDGQIHHFTLQVESAKPRVTVQLQGDQGVQFRLYVSKQGPAGPNTANHTSAAEGAVHTITETLEPGTWFVGVECLTRVESKPHSSGEYFVYSGHTEVLNGAAYELTATSR